MSPVHKLFVYGSLRRGFKNEAYTYLASHFDFLGEGTVNGRIFRGEHSLVATNIANDNGRLVGELYEIKDPAYFDYVIMQLDDYEGVHTEPGHLPLYRRELTVAEVNGQQHPAWVYWFNGDLTGMKPLDESDLMNLVMH